MTPVRVRVLLLVCLGFACPAAGLAQSAAPSRNVAVDPVRCWWRTSAGAVRTGETFTVVLTCAILDTEAVQIVADESRLGSAVIQMAPFEIVGGSHPADLRTPDRRFFQYEYALRVINPDFIGKDVRLPDVVLHYRVNSRIAGNASLQGRDQTYLLPPQVVRVISMVPAVETDIRDASNLTFDSIESLGFRASMLRIVAITLLTLGGLLALISLMRLFTRAKRKTAVASHELGAGTVLRAARRELTSVQSESGQGWTEHLLARALAAARIVAAYALGGSASQRVAEQGAATGEGRLVATARGNKRITVWSAVTAEDIVERLRESAAAAPADRRHLLEELRATLVTFTAAQYARTPTLDRSSLDAALANAIEAALAVRGEHAWPKAQYRRWRGATAASDQRP